MAARWYYGREETRMGPFSAVEMKALASSGGVLPEDTVWQEGVERGVPARKVKNLFPPRGGVPAVAVAPQLAAEVLATGGAGLSAPDSSLPADGAAGATISPVIPVLETPPAPAALDSAGKRPGTSSSGWQEAPTRKGRASAGRGAVIVGQDGVNVKVRKKCTVCGYLDSSWATVPIRNGTTKMIYYCPKCRKSRDVEVVGSLS